MRLSRPRLLLRAALLVFLAGFMAWRARDTGLSSAEPGLEAGAALLLSRIALLEWVLAGLALVVAGAALLRLRPGSRQRSPRLDGAPDPGEPPPESPGGAAAPTPYKEPP